MLSKIKDMHLEGDMLGSYMEARGGNNDRHGVLLCTCMKLSKIKTI